MTESLKQRLFPIACLVAVAAPATWLANVFFVAGDKTPLLPGTSTNGHYQIESQCHLCHTNERNDRSFTSSGVPNSACLSCHGDDLAEFGDSHPVRKFRNPENAVFLEHIDAMSCIACHGEHNPKVTGEMAVTLPADYCAHCHEVTLENIESHRDLDYGTCATAGCHNFHDNMPLAPSFLLKHYGEPDVHPDAGVDTPAALARWLAEGNEERKALGRDDTDAPAAHASDSSLVDNWHHSAHAAAGINCSDCHEGAENAGWVAEPDHRSCQSCHGFEVETFLKGKHGMRLAHDNLSPMRPELARRAMKDDSGHRTLDCNACHQPHRYDRDFAAHQACLQCHDDSHSNGYGNSAHFRLWEAELAGLGGEGSGVSCATCHMPVVEHDGHHAVSHDQSANLTPNEKMLRSVCMDCHGLQFAMDSLADSSLVDANFTAPPQQRHPGISWTVESAVGRGDEEIIRLKQWLETHPGRSRNDLPPPAEDPSQDTQ